MVDRADITRSESAQNFLKAMFALQQGEARVTTNELAGLLGMKAPSITDMGQRLTEAGLLDYQKYQGMILTDAGRALALKIIRRHRLIELYLVNELGYALHEVHDEAENLEHAVSDRFVEALAARLDDPLTDPHGDPIPSADGAIIQRELDRLSEWPLQQPAVVARIKSSNQAMLQYILDRGFHLEARVKVIEREPFNGPITIQVDGATQVIGHQVADCILVEAEPT
jgi:DtxR family Mn-dependent transcriptional regulator